MSEKKKQQPTTSKEAREKSNSEQESSLPRTGEPELRDISDEEHNAYFERLKSGRCFIQYTDENEAAYFKAACKGKIRGKYEPEPD